MKQQSVQILYLSLGNKTLPGSDERDARPHTFYPSSFTNCPACPSNPGNTVFKSLFPRYRDTTSLSTSLKSVVTARSRPSYNCDWSSFGQLGGAD